MFDRCLYALGRQRFRENRPQLDEDTAGGGDILETEIWEQRSSEKSQEPAQPIRVLDGRRDLRSFAGRQYVHFSFTFIQPLVCLIFGVNVVRYRVTYEPRVLPRPPDKQD